MECGGWMESMGPTEDMTSATRCFLEDSFASKREDAEKPNALLGNKDSRTSVGHPSHTSKRVIECVC